MSKHLPTWAQDIMDIYGSHCGGTKEIPCAICDYGLTTSSIGYLDDWDCVDAPLVAEWMMKQ